MAALSVTFFRKFTINVIIKGTPIPIIINTVLP